MEKLCFFTLLKIPFFEFNNRMYMWSVTVSSKTLIPHPSIIDFINNLKKDCEETFIENDSCGIRTYNIAKEGLEIILQKMLSKEKRLNLIEKIDMRYSGSNYSVSIV